MRGGQVPSYLDDENGYEYVMLFDEKTQKYVKQYVHILVAKAFVPNPDNKPHVRHKDGNIWNNRADNLEWSDQPEN